jgi:hypothetical protein
VDPPISSSGSPPSKLSASPEDLEREELRAFSIVLGGPLFQLFRRIRLTGAALELVKRRTLVLVGFAWLPLLFLSLAERHAWSGVTEPFFLDADVHARLLIALPLLVFGELFVHQRVRTAIRQFLARGIITGEALAKCVAAERTALRVRDSPIAEVLLILCVYGLGGAVLWNQLVHVDVDSWYRRIVDHSTYMTPAGWWYRLVSLPLFQFIIFRWYFRLGIWAWFLWKVTRNGLSLIPTHPDRSGGLGFMGNFCYALVPFLMAHGALFAGVVTVGFFFDGRTLRSYYPEVGALAGFAILIALGPLLTFAPTLTRTKRLGLGEYGNLAQRYVYDFDRKWLRRGPPPDQQLLGTGDIQSLADIANAYQVIVSMRLVPISPQIALRLVVLTLVPLAPLLLTVIPARELISMLLKGLF